jgi:putative YhbY family RNA-binding protein
MPALSLSPADRRTHRASAHHLDPVVMIGGDGLTPGVVKEVDGALRAHGLIKIRASMDDRATREAAWHALADELNAAPVQHIGKLLVLWRPKPAAVRSAPREDRGDGPRLVTLVKFSKSGNHRPQVKKVRVLGNERVAAGGEIKRSRPRKASLKKTVAR